MSRLMIEIQFRTDYYPSGWREPLNRKGDIERFDEETGIAQGLIQAGFAEQLRVIKQDHRKRLNTAKPKAGS
jgi:hypothetical protein